MKDAHVISSLLHLTIVFQQANLDYPFPLGFFLLLIRYRIRGVSGTGYPAIYKNNVYIEYYAGTTFIIVQLR